MKPWLSIIFYLGLISCAYASSADVNTANRLYAEGRYKDALDLYKRSLASSGKNADLINYDLGTALYKDGNYKEAAAYLQKSLNTKRLKTSPQYNLGNAQYKLGMQVKDRNIDEAIKDLENALGNFKQVISVDAKDADAKFNAGIVKDQLELLKKEKKKQEQQNRQQEGQQQKSSEQQQKESQEKNDKAAQEKQSQQQSEPGKEEKSKPQEQKEAQEQKKPEVKKAQEQGSNEKDKSQGQKKDGEKASSLQELSPKEAKDILQEYQRNEEPQGLLNFIPKNKEDKPVDKDW